MTKVREKQIIELIAAAKDISGKSMEVVLRLDTAEEVSFAKQYLKGKRGAFKNVKPKLAA